MMVDLCEVDLCEFLIFVRLCAQKVLERLLGRFLLKCFLLKSLQKIKFHLLKTNIFDQ